MLYRALIEKLRLYHKVLLLMLPQNPEYADVTNLFKQAADAIEALTESKWISVKDQLPEKNDSWCLVRCNEYGGWITRIALFTPYSTVKFRERNGPDIELNWIDITKYVTHWMPLPKPPKEET